MKVAILTQPLHHNYGGLLQAFAMQKALIKIGVHPVTLDVQYKKSLLLESRWTLSKAIRKYIFKQNVGRVLPIPRSEILLAQKETNKFINKNINVGGRLNGVKELGSFDLTSYKAVLVGSDQVWRASYSPNIESYFLDFVHDEDIIKLSYAASFGTATLEEYTEENVSNCKRLLNEFDFVSVRENDAVTLCKNKFDVEAQHVLDPTMLLSPQDYLNVFIADKAQSKITTYVLDESERAINSIRFFEKKAGLISEPIGRPVDGVYPSVESWLKGIYEASFIITDSFHGVVFSIIFNKQFVCLGNRQRGMSRFYSLLDMFDLSDRLIMSEDELTENLISNVIDFETVNKRLSKLRNMSYEYLNSALCE
ncbi:hypothetical protein BWP24_15520 [Vibrio campbellii]|uniref:polysaccharide pyruvyl transferase family protein n=1 Tax=Vibrio campbellii TaxID=680 RepID=UPI0009719610|nr:polysaccharide pyruvyl transferase family protein [Vibrio campbellii]APX07495.1 hypothetical protein BWP24_15520 [Vibrio campbellii]ARR07726.1 hypothetical protein Vc3S01_2967 [Vibrio campbellii]